MLNSCFSNCTVNFMLFCEINVGASVVRVTSQSFLQQEAGAVALESRAQETSSEHHGLPRRRKGKSEGQEGALLNVTYPTIALPVCIAVVFSLAL